MPIGLVSQSSLTPLRDALAFWIGNAVRNAGGILPTAHVCLDAGKRFWKAEGVQDGSFNLIAVGSEMPRPISSWEQLD